MGVSATVCMRCMVTQWGITCNAWRDSQLIACRHSGLRRSRTRHDSRQDPTRFEPLRLAETASLHETSDAQIVQTIIERT